MLTMHELKSSIKIIKRFVTPVSSCISAYAQTCIWTSPCPVHVQLRLFMTAEVPQEKSVPRLCFFHGLQQDWTELLSSSPSLKTHLFTFCRSQLIFTSQLKSEADMLFFGSTRLLSSCLPTCQIHFCLLKQCSIINDRWYYLS